MAGRCKATWEKKFKLPWREAGPPNYLNEKVDSDQWVLNTESLSLKGADPSNERPEAVVDFLPVQRLLARFRVSGLRFWNSGFGIEVSGFGFWVSDFGFQVQGFGFRISGFGFRV